MIATITDERVPTAAEWDAVWSACDHATYFHCREWAEIWQEHTGGRLCPAPRVVTFSDGCEALLPLARGHWPPGSGLRHLSSPGGTFGGWISADPLGLPHAAALGRYIIGSCPGLVWRLNPYDELQRHSGVRADIHDETQVIPLEAGFDRVIRTWTKGHRSAASKARREGVEVGVAQSAGDWIEYHRVHLDSIRRWGDRARTTYDRRFFERMGERGSPRIRLWTARHSGRLIAGALCFYAGRHVVYWHGAALETHFELRPVHLLMHDAIRHACDNGYAWFDLNPSGALDGVRAFKKSFGARAEPCPVVRRRDRLTSIRLALSRSIVRRFATRPGTAR